MTTNQSDAHQSMRSLIILGQGSLAKFCIPKYLCRPQSVKAATGASKDSAKIDARIFYVFVQMDIIYG